MKRQRIHDAGLSDAARRRAEYCKMLARRLEEHRSGSTRVDRGLALMEASVAAKLVESATYEIGVRLIGHGMSPDIEKDLTAHLAAYRAALAANAASDGDMILA
jgi:hypothetical protein